MQFGMRPAIPMAWPRAIPFGARRLRWMRWIAATVTMITAVAAIMIVAAGAVMLGMT
jgi:hypothetical protein